MIEKFNRRREPRGFGERLRQITTFSSQTNEKPLLSSDARNGLKAVREAYSTLPPDQLTDLLYTAEGIFSQERGDEKARLVQVLFECSTSRHFVPSMQKKGLRLEQLPDLLNSSMTPFISTMLDHSEIYRLPLGIIFSHVTIDQIPKDVQTKLDPHISQIRCAIEPSHEGWWLCPTGELNLTQAITDQAVMTIQDERTNCLLVKLQGKLSAVCLKNTVTNNGNVFIAGNWYSPTDQKTRAALRKNFGDQKGRAALETGSWALMRPIRSFDNKFTEKLLKEAQQVAQRIPAVYPTNEMFVKNHKMTRGAYQEFYQEDEYPPTNRF